MGIKKSQVKWTGEELAYLKANWGDMGGKVCSKLKGHSEPAVRQKAKELGLKRTSGKNSYWTDEEAYFLKENAEELSGREIAERLGRPASTVFWMMHKYGIRKRGA